MESDLSRLQRLPARQCQSWQAGASIEGRAWKKFPNPARHQLLLQATGRRVCPRLHPSFFKNAFGIDITPEYFPNEIIKSQRKNILKMRGFISHPLLLKLQS